MSWLAIETSSGCVSLALGEQSRCLREVSQNGNASILMEPLFRKLDADFKKIDRCVISRGPGSYNGLRVGYAFLKGLLCFEPAPVIQVGTPLILAAKAMDELKKKDGSALVLHDARRGEIHAAWIAVREGLPRQEWERVGKENEIRGQFSDGLDAIVSHDFSAADLPGFHAKHWLKLFPSASMAGRIAHRLNLPATSNLSSLEPLYVRGLATSGAPSL